MTPDDCLAHLGVVAGLLVEDRTAGPRVAEGQLSVGLAQRAAAEAPGEDARHHLLLRNAVLLNDAHADLDVHAQSAERGDDAQRHVALVGDALEGLELARHRALWAEASVEALRRVHQAVEDPCTPLSRHCCDSYSLSIKKNASKSVTFNSIYTQSVLAVNLLASRDADMEQEKTENLGALHENRFAILPHPDVHRAVLGQTWHCQPAGHVSQLQFPLHLARAARTTKANRAQ
jgi:hypothetical protein